MTPGWHARQTPDRPAIIMASGGQTVTYRELEQRSIRGACALRARGLRAGDHIAILMENNQAFLEIAWAAQRFGLYHTAIDWHLTAGEVQYILDDCGGTALVASDAVADVVQQLDLSRVLVRICGAGDLPGFERYEQALSAESDDALGVDECEGREMLYSSGTTGRPKGIRKPLPATALGDPTAPPVQIARGLLVNGDTDGAVYLSPAPLYHGAPLVFSMSWHRLGGTVVVMERFDPTRCLELIERHQVTHIQMVPTMFVRMLRLPAAERAHHDISSLIDVVHSAAPCPIAIKRQMLDWWGPIISEYYSGTEDVGNTYITAEEWLDRPGSVGRPAQQCHIVGDDGTELPPGEVGEVHFAGGRPFEYHHDEAKTASATHPKGWRTIGDMGYLDADGYLYLTDRKAHMIISGGVNIYPQEAENILAAHPAVADVAVIGVPDEEMGEAVKAVIEPADPPAADTALEAELLAFCRTTLAAYKCPRSVDFVDELPRDPSGKLYKRRLRESYWKEHDNLII
ncbi:acyl-CoA synthetase [Williamsia sp.]|uniref:acyl-CoA synthetase n=1 Tax=Williamsia sp. TaxID=1872085 RepID=UPI002F92130C